MITKNYILKIFVATLGLAGVLTAVIFYYENLRGVGPALRPVATGVINVPAGNNTPTSPATAALPLSLPQGFDISIYAKNLGGPRVLTSDTLGRVLVSVPSQGKIMVLEDKNKDGIAEKQITLISGLNYPHGMDWQCEQERCEKLFVAETDKITEYAYDLEAAKAIFIRKIIDLPRGGNHTTRTILFLKDPQTKLPTNQLLVSIGSSCNVCRETDALRASIQIVDINTGEMKLFATGLRNSVFLTNHPITNELWATDMGRDLLGDNLPPDEINIIKQGGNYGWPVCYGKNVHDGAFDKNTYIRNPCMEPFEKPSLIDLPAHSAPLGLAFIAGDGWPKDYQNNLLVAYHGSWNRSVPTGYKIVRHKFDATGNYIGVEDFITGWLPEGKTRALGRPVDILIMPNGTMYISDDKAGVVYKVVYKER